MQSTHRHSAHRRGIPTDPTELAVFSPNVQSTRVPGEMLCRRRRGDVWSRHQRARRSAANKAPFTAKPERWFLPCAVACDAQHVLSSHSPLTTDHEPRTTNHEPRTKNHEPRTKNQEPRTKNQEPRTKNNCPLRLYPLAAGPSDPLGELLPVNWIHRVNRPVGHQVIQRLTFERSRLLGVLRLFVWQILRLGPRD